MAILYRLKNILLIVIIVSFSCKEQTDNKESDALRLKIDSLLLEQKKYKNSAIYEFYKVHTQEKNTLNDTVLLPEYKAITGRDKLIDLYIWDRIHTITQNAKNINVYAKFKGDYLLKPNHNKKYAQITKIKIKNDSCYLYKDGFLVVKDRFKRVNSSNRYLEGKLIIHSFRLLLDGGIKERLTIQLEDNNCMDCQHLQFMKL